MNGKNSRNFKQRMVTVLAIVIVLSLILSLAAPFFGVFAYAAKPTAAAEIAVAAEDLEEQAVKDLPEEINDGRFYIDAKIGFDGEYILEKHTPFKFIVTNNGEDFKGRLNLKAELSNPYGDSNRYAVFYSDLELTKGAAKEININADISVLSNFSTVYLTNEKGKTVFLKNFKIAPKDPNSVWTGVLSDNPSELVYLKQNDVYYNQQSTHYYGVDYFKTVYLSKEDVSEDYRVLENFRMLIINDFNTSVLSENQVNALKKWLERGGLLVLGTGVNAQKVLGGLFELGEFDFSSDIKTVTMGGAEGVVVSDAAVNGGNVVISENNIATTSSLSVGEGKIILHNFDLGKNPLPQISQMAEVLRGVYEKEFPLKFFVDGNDSWGNKNSYNPIQDMSGRISTVKGSGITVIFIIIALYIIAVGPVIYVFLKKRDIREKGWIIIPALALITSAVIFAIGSKSYYRGSILSTASRVDVVYGSSTGKAEIFASIKSRDKGRLDFRAEENLDLDVFVKNNYRYESQSGLAMEINTSGKSEITYLDKERWEESNFKTMKNIDLGGAIDADVVFKDGRFSGTITNNTSYDLQDIIFDFGTQLIRIGDCVSGETKELTAENLDIADRNNYSYGINSDTWEVFEIEYNRGMSASEEMFIKYGRARTLDNIRYDRTVSSSLSENPFTLKVYAFSDESLIKGSKYLNGKKMNEQNNTVFVMDVPVGVESGEIQLPFGYISPMDMYDEFGNYYETFRTGGNSAYVYQDGIMNSGFVIPSYLTVESFQIKWPVVYGNVEELYIFNSTENVWEKLYENLYTNPYEYISSDGEILIQAKVMADTEIEMPQVSIKGEVTND